VGPRATELAAGVAHDVSNTLGAIRLRLSSLSRDAACVAAQGASRAALRRIVPTARSSRRSYSAWVTTMSGRSRAMVRLGGVVTTENRAEGGAVCTLRFPLCARRALILREHVARAGGFY
jgi:hypothetical protein